MRILVVEDDRKVLGFIRQGLEEEGHTVETAADGDGALDLLLATDPYDLIVLDVMLPKRDGFAVLKAARQAGVHSPVIMLTARDSVADKVAGLDLGADDYLAKPFAFDELLARVRARLRRRGDDGGTALRAGSIELDLLTRRASAGDRAVELTGREFALLETLLRHPRQVLSREQLLSRVWGLSFDPGSNLVDVYVGYLRRKLGEDVVETVRGVGYRLNPDAYSESSGQDGEARLAGVGQKQHETR